MVEVDMKNAAYICDKFIYKLYNRLRLPGVVIHFEQDNSGLQT